MGQNSHKRTKNQEVKGNPNTQVTKPQEKWAGAQQAPNPGGAQPTNRGPGRPSPSAAEEGAPGRSHTPSNNQTKRRPRAKRTTARQGHRTPQPEPSTTGQRTTEGEGLAEPTNPGGEHQDRQHTQVQEDDTRLGGAHQKPVESTRPGGKHHTWRCTQVPEGDTQS